MTKFTESDQKSQRTVRFFNKLSLDLKVLFYEPGFVPRAKVYRARKHKADIAIHLDLIKRRYSLLKDAYSKDKDCTSVDIAYADINCSLLEELERLLLEI